MGIHLSTGMRISIYVYGTDKRAAARVVYIDLRTPCIAGLSLMSRETFGEYSCHRMTGEDEETVTPKWREPQFLLMERRFP